MKRYLTYVLKSFLLSIFFLQSFTAYSQWEKVSTGLNGGSIGRLLIKGSDIYASVGVAGLYKSTDQGNTWIEANNGKGKSDVRCLATDGVRIFAGSVNDDAGPYGNMFISEDDGASWVPAECGISVWYINSMAVQGAKVYAATNKSLYVSTDHGISWDTVNNGLPAIEYTSIVASGSYLYLGSIYGVYISADSGSSWNLSYPGLTLHARQINTILVTDNGIFAGTHGGIYRSTDNGTSWNYISSDIPVNQYLEYGAIGQSIYSLIKIGADLFAGTFFNGIYKSVNNGTNWQSINSGTIKATVKALASAQGVVFAGTSSGMYRLMNNDTSWVSINEGIEGTSISSFAFKDSLLFCSSYFGIAKSANEGMNWTMINNGIENKSISTVNCIGATMYAGSGSGVFISHDIGQTWTASNIGFPLQSVTSFVASDSLIFAGAYSTYTAQNCIYVSADNGVSWAASSNGMGPLRVLCLKKFGNYLFAGTTVGSIFRSGDNGNSWTASYPEYTPSPIRSIQSIGNIIIAHSAVEYPLLISSDSGNTWTKIPFNTPGYPSIYSIEVFGQYLVAATNKGVYVSADTAASWYPVNDGFDNTEVSKLGYDGTYLYAAIYGSGAWRRPFSSIGQSSFDGLVICNNAQSTPMANVVVMLQQNGITYKQTTTDSLGHFSFQNLNPGNYELQCSLSKPWGGVNATDALLIQKQFAGLISLSGINLKAADVNGSNYVNATDALKTNQKFVGLINSFNVGDWITETKSVTVAPGTTSNIVIKVICTGDVNGSFVPQE